jgi:large subunit ribosomal protein L30|tara:strand:- start:685 stop:864 length:180 start_codon:yes stop_codon:yes gene_type:complete
MSKIRITQKKSVIKRPQNQKLNIISLGLGKINRSVEVEKTPEVLGKIEKVKHLVEVIDL